jgi:DNA modification methylase
VTGRILTGDALEMLRRLADASVHCVVTSPPYFGLRDYQTGTWDGGDPECDHAPAQDWVADGGDMRRSHPAIAGNQAKAERRRGARCACGAVKVDQQVGLESSPDAYIVRLVELCREVRRVLRDDGTFWLNLGDTYCNDQKGPKGADKSTLTGGGDYQMIAAPRSLGQMRYREWGNKRKDLLMIPAQVALALRDDGWYLRQDIIWAKDNPMPESVRDRCTRSHEHLFLLTKRERYYFDAEAIKEPAVTESRGKRNSFARKSAIGLDEVHYGKGTMRNKRDVWRVNTRPFAEAHFATFPPALIVDCIRAGTSAAGVCADCGAPWQRVITRTSMVIDRSERTHDLGRTRTSGTMVEPPTTTTTTTTGWKPGCGCAAGIVPATVLDPFFGSGTTGLVAEVEGRDWIGIDLNADYVVIARRRIAKARLARFAAAGVGALAWLACAQ